MYESTPFGYGNIHDNKSIQMTINQYKSNDNDYKMNRLEVLIISGFN